MLHHMFSTRSSMEIWSDRVSADRPVIGAGSAAASAAACVIALMVSACAGTSHFSAPARGAIETAALASEYLQAYQQRFPEAILGSGSTLFDNSLAAYAAWDAREADFLERLLPLQRSLDPAAPEALTLALLRERLEMSQQFRACRRELWNVGPLTGWLNEYRGYAARQPHGSDAERRAALQRWSKLPAFVRTEIANLDAGVEMGYSAPRRLVVDAIAQADQVLALPPRDSPFFAPARSDTSPSYRQAFEQLVRDSITPAIRRHRDYLATWYAPRARSSVGTGALPDGRACFRALVRRYTTLEMQPQELTERGRALLALDGGLIRNRQQQLIADPANRFSNSREALDAFADALRRAAEAVPRWFGRLPNVLTTEVDSLPDGGPSDPEAQYMPASRGDPARVYVNVPKILDLGGKLYAERLAFHEGTPGHHLQIALQRSADAHPLNRILFNTAFAEGWAVYASNLADEMGLYSSEAARFGVRKADVDDGLTFVLQAGLHVQSWTREQAIDTLLKYSAVTLRDATEQIDYFIAAPGHALAYPVGARFIATLRQDATRRLGTDFDVRGFHDVILGSGGLPLGALREAVERWVRNRERR